MINDLEEAIQVHLANERRELNPNLNPAAVRRTQIHIKVFENAPRESNVLKQRIVQIKRKMQSCRDMDRTEALYAELQALGRLLGTDNLAEAGRPLDGLGY